MATIHRPSTPPPSFLHTPNTPRYGFDDSYQPYSPRKSARVMQRSRDAAQTPPPIPHPSRAAKKASSDLSSSPLSPQTASKKRTPGNSPVMSGRRVSGALTYDSTASAAASLGLPTPTTDRKQPQTLARAITNNGMLPTPAKTPNRRPEKMAPGVKAVARTLHFGTRADEVMPSPKKKKGGKYNGFSLETEKGSSSIEIFTDSNDRIPELDASDENPFYGDAVAAPEPTKRSSRRQKVIVPGEKDQSVDELVGRRDGLVMNFRGKKVFHKDEASASIAPRLLFPSEQQKRAKAAREHTTSDEEADTDIEESTNIFSTPSDQFHKDLATPKAPRFAPSSPPTTLRSTRSRKIALCSSPIAGVSDDESPLTSPDLPSHPKIGAKVTPAEQLPDDKQIMSPGKNKKRDGDQLASSREKRRVHH